MVYTSGLKDATLTSSKLGKALGVRMVVEMMCGGYWTMRE